MARANGYRLPAGKKPVKEELVRLMAAGEIHAWWAYAADEWVVTRTEQETHGYLLVNNQNYRARMIRKAEEAGDELKVARLARVGDGAIPVGTPMEMTFPEVKATLNLGEAPKPKRTGKAELLVLSRQLLEFVRNHPDAQELVSRADILLEAA